MPTAYVLVLSAVTNQRQLIQLYRRPGDSTLANQLRLEMAPPKRTQEMNIRSPLRGISDALGLSDDSRRRYCGHLYGGETVMVRWNRAFLKVALSLGAFVALVIASGAGYRWG
jgi:hypothetical protein